MDAGQIMMMPAAATIPASAGVVTDVQGKLSPSIGLFSSVLGQNLLGLIGAGHQCCLGQQQKSGIPLASAEIPTVFAPKTVEQGALLTDVDVAATVNLFSGPAEKSVEQNAAQEDSATTVVNPLSVYAQLAVLQTGLPMQQPQQAAPVATEEATALSVPERVATVDSGVQITDVGVPGVLSMVAAEKPAHGTAVKNVADSTKESVVPQNEMQQAMNARIEAVVTAKVVTMPPQSTAANNKPQMSAVDVPVTPVQQQEVNVNVESERQVQKSQVYVQHVVQQAAEARPVAQETPEAVKVTTTAVPQPVRFAQQPDVVAAAAGSEQQKNPSSEQQDQGSQLMAKPSKELLVPSEQVKPQLVESKAVTFSLPEQHAVPMHVGQPVVIAADGPTVEASKAVTQEMIGRQVVDRLASHEIKQGNDQISLKLSPENLGNLQLNMRMDDNRLKLEIVAENRGVRDALLQQADDLKETLARQNIKVDSFNVTTGGNGGQSQQQSADWRQMTQEQRQYQPQYASLRAKDGVLTGSEAPVKYFVPQYQSTIDVRF